MQRTSKIILSLIIAFILGAVSSGLITYKVVKPIPSDPIIVHDSIFQKMDSLNQRIDTIYVIKEKLVIQHDEKVEQIYNQSSSADWIYFTEYLRRRFPNGLDSIKGN